MREKTQVLIQQIMQDAVASPQVWGKREEDIYVTLLTETTGHSVGRSTDS